MGIDQPPVRGCHLKEYVGARFPIVNGNAQTCSQLWNVASDRASGLSDLGLSKNPYAVKVGDLQRV